MCVCARERWQSVWFFRPSVCFRPEINKNQRQPWQHAHASSNQLLSIARAKWRPAGKAIKATTIKRQEQQQQSQSQRQPETLQLHTHVYTTIVAPTGGSLLQLVDHLCIANLSFDFRSEFFCCCCCQLSQLAGHVFAAAAS